MIFLDYMWQIYHTQYLYLNNMFSTNTTTTTMLEVVTATAAISSGGGGGDMCNMASRLYKFHSEHLVI